MGTCGFEYNTCRGPLYFGADTMINAVVYHRLYRGGTWCDWQFTGPMPPVPPCQFSGGFASPGFLTAYMRQDIPQRKVYLYNTSLASEEVLYDFYLSAGDTVPQTVNNPFYPNVVVVRVDSVLLGDGLNHARYVLNVQGLNGDSLALIEGVGSTFGLLSDLVTPFENHDLLQCMGDSTQTIYPNGAATCVLALGMNTLASSEPEIFPNPFTDVLWFRDMPANGTVELFSSDGRLIQSLDADGLVSMDVSGLASGVYCLRYNGNTPMLKKLIKF